MQGGVYENCGLMNSNTHLGGTFGGGGGVRAEVGEPMTLGRGGCCGELLPALSSKLPKPLT